jgi:hypothetical protein
MRAQQVEALAMALPRAALEQLLRNLIFYLDILDGDFDQEPDNAE